MPIPHWKERVQRFVDHKFDWDDVRHKGYEDQLTAFIESELALERERVLDAVREALKHIEMIHMGSESYGYKRAYLVDDVLKALTKGTDRPPAQSSDTDLKSTKPNTLT